MSDNHLRDAISDLRQDIRDMRSDVRRLTDKHELRLSALEQWRWRWVGAFAALAFIVDIAVKYFTSHK